MKSTSESLSASEMSNGRVAGGNCVAVKRGGEQPEAKPQSQTQVNPIRPATTASLLANGEACCESSNRSNRHLSSKVKGRVVTGGWGGNVEKVSWWTIENCLGRQSRERGQAVVRAVIVAEKRSNSRGAKDGRKVERQKL